MRDEILHRLGRGFFDAVDHVVHPSEGRDMPDPAQQRADHQQDDEHGRREQDDPAIMAVGAGVQPDDAHHREDEGAEEGRQHVLRSRIAHHQLGRARCCELRRRGIGAHHRRQGKGGDRQHAGGHDLKDRAHRLLPDIGIERIG